MSQEVAEAPMKRATPRSSRRLFSEFVVVLLGVFLALAAESWWSERADRQFERELREDMLAEFEANLRILESDISVNDTTQIRFGFLPRLTDAELAAVSDEELTRRLGGYLDWAGFDPAMGIVQALVESGNLRAVDDRPLRLLLSRWAGLLEEKRRFNLQTVDFQNMVVTPAVARVAADLRWTAAERREVRDLMLGLSGLQQAVVENQRRLRDTALEVQRYLENGG
ncbi:MAG: hypothetical protein HKN37_12390 [Rhodothermales bacterium]|nr:hypothetical protein [Rhodothermales bacterium]